jgi:hypothetical protein
VDRFDEDTLVQELDRLPYTARIAFAAATAARQLCCYERYAHRFGLASVQWPREILGHLLRDIEGVPTVDAEI